MSQKNIWGQVWYGSPIVISTIEFYYDGFLFYPEICRMGPFFWRSFPATPKFSWGGKMFSGLALGTWLPLLLLMQGEMGGWGEQRKARAACSQGNPWNLAPMWAGGEPQTSDKVSGYPLFSPGWNTLFGSNSYWMTLDTPPPHLPHPCSCHLLTTGMV